MEIQRFLDFSKPFVEATRNIFETMVFTKIDTQKPSIKESSISKGDVSAILGLNGAFEAGDNSTYYKAMLVISFPYETYCKVASAMLMEEHKSYNQEISDVAGEICNMIMGNAKRDLSSAGYSTSMGIPTIIEGKEHSIHYPSNATVIIIPIGCDHGHFYLELCYKDGFDEDEKLIDYTIKKS